MGSEANHGFARSSGKHDANWHQERFNRFLEFVQNAQPVAQTVAESGDSVAFEIEDFGTSIQHVTPDQLGRLFQELAINRELLAQPEAASALEAIFQLFARRPVNEPSKFDNAWLDATDFETVYRSIPAESNSRNHLLSALAAMDSDQALKLFANLLSTDPPADERGILLSFAPLVNGSRKYDVSLLFPDLLEALKYKHLAAIILDLANYCYRNGMTDVHPVKPRTQQLTVLLGQVVNQLAMIEEGKLDGRSANEISDSVNESVALTVSLCDALAQADTQKAVGKVRQAMGLKHRRVKTEAAAALIRLGDTDEGEGKKQLVELAAEPICRLRVIEYARELGLLDEIDEDDQGPAALAESQLALWLASPAQMGVSPTSMEVVHHSRLRWPGFQEAVDCFLIRFEYRFAGQTYSNIGLVGPVTHAFACNLEHLSYREILAAFAGWQTEHEDVYTIDIEKAREAMPGTVETLSRRVKASYDEMQLHFLGFFFETPSLIASVTEESAGGELRSLVVMDRDNEYVFGAGSSYSPLTPELAFEIYKGLQLLVAFNDPEIFEQYEL